MPPHLLTPSTLLTLAVLEGSGAHLSSDLPLRGALRFHCYTRSDGTSACLWAAEIRWEELP